MASECLKYIDMSELKDMKGLQIVHINVRGLQSKIDVIRNDMLGSNIDVLCITESWLHDCVGDNMIAIDGFQILRNDREYCRGGGTYLNNRLKFANIVDSVNNRNIEIQTVLLLGNTSNHRCKEINLVVAYRPPSGNNRKGKEQLIAFCDSLPGNLNRELVILGDLNWNVSNKKETSYKIVKEIEGALGVEQLINCPTRITVHSNSIIDLIFSNISNRAHYGCLNYNISDHLPVYIIKKKEVQKQAVKKVYKRSFKNYDRLFFQERLSKLDWSTIDLLGNVNEMWNMVCSRIAYEANILCPYRWSNIKQNAHVWYNSSLKSIALERDRLFRAFNRSKRKNVALYTLATNKRKEHNRETKKCKENFF